MTTLDTSPQPRGWRGLLTPGSPATRADVAWNLITLAVMLGAVFAHSGHLRSPGPELLAFTFAAWLPLTVRTRWPDPVLLAVVLVSVTQLLAMPSLGSNTSGGVAVGAYQPVPVAAMLAVYTVASRRRPRDALACGVLTSATLAGAALTGPDQIHSGTIVVMVELVLIAAGTGIGVRGRHELLARRAHDQEEQARRAVLEERLRIARELHDTLAHNLALIDAQAGVANYLIDTNAPAAREALRGITDHTKSALEDLRVTLQLLRSDDRPASTPGIPPIDVTVDPTEDAASTQPVVGLAQLDVLVDRVQGTGTPITVSTDGEPGTLSHQTDLAAYRIIQEALTNATKHAARAPTTIGLSWRPGWLHLEVTNRPSPQTILRGAGTGHGLIGLAERARVAGGTLTAGPTADGGFQVSADLPTSLVSRVTPTQDDISQECQ